ncbi:MAG: MBL fold metallo-hydrolase, partial [Rikenellaceae bacterium]|nr:MBL fold metallo-hydrolase [Rikenellaceae bacterium]
MRKALFSFFAVVALISLPSVASAQEDVAYWGKEDAYLLRQAKYMYELVDESLDEYPPVVGAPTSRKLALYNLDAMLHETKYDNTEPFKSFVASRTSKVIADMQSPVKKGMKIYKIYNDGFVARTKSVTIAFDVVRGELNAESIVSEKDIATIVDQCDVLFLTHNHGDHVDRYVADRFIAAGKPVIAADEILKDVEGVTHYRSETEILNKEVKLLSGDVLKVKIYPGHQSEMMCNVYAVTTPDGLTVAHT